MLNGEDLRGLLLLRPLIRRLLAALQKLCLGDAAVAVGIVQRQIQAQGLRYLCSLQVTVSHLAVRMLSGQRQIQAPVHLFPASAFLRLCPLLLPFPAAGIPVAPGRNRKLFKVLPGALADMSRSRNGSLGQHAHQGLLRDIDQADQDSQQKQHHSAHLSENRMQHQGQGTAYSAAAQGALRTGFKKFPEAHALHAVACAKRQYGGKKDQHKKRCCHLQHRIGIVRIGQKKNHRKQQHQRENVADGAEKPQLQAPESRPDRSAKSEIAEQQDHGGSEGHNNGNLVPHQRLIFHF